MLFNSYIFIFLFLPVCLLGFHILKKKQATLAKVWLTCFSFWFYGYFNFSYLVIMFGSILGNYRFHKKILEKRGQNSKAVLTAGICINLLVLFYFKYYDFFLENLNLVFRTDFVLKGILLPLGISFFTFQQISFLVDTYRGELDECSFLDYALFVSFFPQLIAGPIVTHEEMLPQFAAIGRNEEIDAAAGEEKEEDRAGKEKDGTGICRKRGTGSGNFARGIYIFVLGMAKKVLLADTFGIAVDYAYSNVAAINGLESFLVILCYSFQLYFDFSGYCDMARGIAEMFDMEITSNFESPYKAANIVEFWKRWHMTLSRFFTRNIYIPLGGNRAGRGRMYLNFLIVFFLSGLWHGAGWNYILWGMMHGILYVVTKFYLDQRKKNTVSVLQKETEENKSVVRIDAGIRRIPGVAVTFSYISLAWVYFRATSIAEANELIGNLWKKPWSLPGASFLEGFSLGELWYPMKILKLTELPYAESYPMFGFLIFSFLMIFFGENISRLGKEFRPTVWNACVTAVLFLWCVVSLSGVSTFLYFNF